MADQYHHGNLKSKLLEEAVTLISQDGLENLSLRRLATQCGVSHNAIYRHFDSKERLIDACRAYVMQEADAHPRADAQRSGRKPAADHGAARHRLSGFLHAQPDVFQRIFPQRIPEADVLA